MLLESLRPPLELILAWQTSRFPHGIRRGWGLVALVGFFAPISLVFVVLRSHLRIRRRSFGIDDALMVFAMLFAAGVDTCIILGFRRYGYDRHVWDVSQPMALQARQMVLAIEQLNSTSTCLTKISILFFYRRLARGTYTSTFVRVVQANIIFVAAYLLVFSVVLFLTCYPFQAYWLQFDIIWVQQNTYKCLNEAATTVVANAISILQDFIACGLPSILLWKLQMRKKQKVLLACLLGLGILPCLAGILRLVYTVHLYSTYDSTWAAYPVLVWTVVETHLGILCASAPAMHSYAKEASRSHAWSSTLNLFKNLSDRSYRHSTSGVRRSHGYSASGHIELSEHGASAGSKAGATRGAVVPDSKNVSQSDTLLSSTLNGTDFSRSFATKDGEDAGDLERGGVVSPQQAFEEQRRREGGMWYLNPTPEISPVRLPDGMPAVYLGPQVRSPSEAEVAISTAGASLREGDGDDEEGEIGVAITAAPMTVVPLNIRRNRD